MNVAPDTLTVKLSVLGVEVPQELLDELFSGKPYDYGQNIFDGNGTSWILGDHQETELLS